LEHVTSVELLVVKDSPFSGSLRPTPLRPEIVVDIDLLPTEQGGRNGPIPSGIFRGVFGVNGEHFSAAFFVSNPGGFAPGEAGQFGVQFLVPDAAVPLFPVGTSFTVWEGRTIGNGCVMEVIEQRPRNP
jgi:hypothetical protein